MEDQKAPLQQQPVAAEVPAPPREIDFSAADVSERYEDVFQIIRPETCLGVRWRENAYEFTCDNGVALRIQVLTNAIVRLRYSPNGIFERDFSYALQPDFEAEKVTVRLSETDNEYLLVSDQLQIVVRKKHLRVLIYDSDDHLLSEDEVGYAAKRTVLKGWCECSLTKRHLRKEVYYGLGDKSCGANLHGKKFENWCTDAFAFGRESDPLYKAVPFYYFLRNGKAGGIFLDNTFRSHFDFNSRADDTTRFWCEGGEMNYYFIYGPGLSEVSAGYARLTGSHALPPLWALGYHQCRWSYYPYTRVLEIADKFRELDIPCDAIYLDIDYMDGYRCFTWNDDHFPDPAQLIADLRARGFRTVTMIDPGLKEDPDYAVYADALEKGYLLKNADGHIASAPVWPGFCGFPDFTHPEVRHWWGNLYEDMYREKGVAGFWNDMNEPAVFHVHHKTLPDHVLHHYEGAPCGHRRAHNIYGLQMARASWEGFRRLQPEQRPFLLSRASFSGGQRYGAVWTGDNVSDWEHLQIANVQCVRLSVSGFSFCGSDIGGFAGTADGELFVRWLQLGVFHPLMRVHSMGQHTGGDMAVQEEAELAAPELHQTDQEPWSFGEKYTALTKKAIELRYALLPYLYTAMWQNSRSGVPVLRHLAFDDPAEPRHWDNERDFIFGEHLLVSPVVQPKIHRQMVVLPKGNWYNFWTGQSGNGEMFINILPDQIPFFVREGAVLPIYPARQWTDEKPVEELTLYVYYKNGRETSHLYEDAGEGYAYQRGEYCLQFFESEGSETGFTLRQRREGNFLPTYTRVKIYLVGFPTFARQCRVDGQEAPIKEIRLRDRSLYTLMTSPDFSEIVWNV